MKYEAIERGANLIYWPWNHARKQGRIVGYSLFLLGFAWVIPCIVVVGLPMMLYDIVLMLDKELRR